MAMPLETNMKARSLCRNKKKLEIPTHVRQSQSEIENLGLYCSKSSNFNKKGAIRVKYTTEAIF